MSEISAMGAPVAGAKPPPDDTEDGYADLMAYVRNRAAAAPGPVFRTSAPRAELWAAYLNGIPADKRQHYNCRCCRRFIETYGGLVTLGPKGHSVPLLWATDFHAVPPFFRESVANLHSLVLRATVVGVFLSCDGIWGTPKTEPWSHLSATAPLALIRDVNVLKSSDQEAAERAQDFGIVQRAIEDFPVHAIEQAVSVLESETVPNGEACLGTAKWFRELLYAIGPVSNPRVRANLVWKAVATAPTGYAHFRTGMLSTLLADIIAGLPFTELKRNWVAKMHPLKYRRPQAAPTDGQVDNAERVVAKLGIAPALARRFATRDEVQVKLWEAVPLAAEIPTARSGQFAHVRPAAVTRAAARPIELPAQTMTWAKFARTVLPGALDVYLRVPRGNQQFYGLTTATDAAAPPVFQWDGLADAPARNPVSWYVYNNGSPASQWGLPAPGWAKVTAVFLAPFAWHKPELFGHHVDRVFFALEGARDAGTPGLALFPSLLRSELNPIRHTIEAHSKAGTLTGAEAGDANGLVYVKGATGAGPHFWVRSAAATFGVTLDRWD